MNISASTRVSSIGAYAFAAVDEKVAELKKSGITPIDFGVGDYADPTPSLIRGAGKKGIDKRASEGYPSYVGAPEFRQAIAAWIGRRFGCKIDAATQITSTVGSKEGIFNFHEGF